MTSGHQASGYLLCAKCEGRFNTGGETWVIPRLWHDEAKFPLRQALLGHGGLPFSTSEFSVFEAAKIATVRPEQLVYFAASIFWRAAVHDWQFHDRTTIRLKLGPYEEAFRRYLLGGRWPSNAILFVSSAPTWILCETARQRRLTF